MRFLDPCPFEPLKRLDGFRRVVLHTLEDDDPITGRLNLVLVDAELVTHTEVLDLLLQQPLGRFLDPS